MRTAIDRSLETRPSGAAGTVLVRTFADSGHAVLEVEDDGVGRRAQ
jgi:hypothetical protein